MKKIVIVAFIISIFCLVGCLDNFVPVEQCDETLEEPKYPHWSPTPEQREMSTEELRELLKPIYEYKEKMNNLE